MACCSLDIYMNANGDLFCNSCRKLIITEVKKSKDSGRCVVKYVCPLCGNDRHCDCNTKMRVKLDRGDTTIVCKPV